MAGNKSPTSGKEIVVFNADSPGKKAKASWIPEDFMYPLDYWVSTCGLPNEGVLPGKLIDEQVSKKRLDECFGQRHGPSGRHGFKLEDCKGISKEDILALTQVLDGHECPVNGFLGINLAKGLYWDLIANEKVNWAGFAAEKHKGQINNAHKRKDAVPTGPPIIRKERRYMPRSKSVAEKPPAVESTCPHLSVEAFCASNIPSPCPSRLGHEVARSAIDRKLFRSPEASKLAVDSQINHADGAEGADLGSLSCEEYEQSSSPDAALGSLVAQQIECLERNINARRAELKALEGQSRSEHTQRDGTQPIITKLTGDAMRIQADIMEIESRRSDMYSAYSSAQEKYNADCEQAQEEPKEDDSTRIALESQEAEITRFEADLVKLIDEIGANKKTFDKIEKERREQESKQIGHSATINAVREKITALEEAIEAESNKLSICQEERKALSVGARVVNSLKPVAIPTPIEVQKALFRMSSCAKCTLAYQCNNFVPTSCGHTYHPACIVQQLSIEGSDPPRCLACHQIFHPDWLESWGVCHTAPEVQQLASDLSVLLHREVFQRDLQTLYVGGCHLLQQRKLEERLKQQKLTRFYTKGMEDAEFTHRPVKLKVRLSNLATMVPQVGLTPASDNFVHEENTELGAEHGSTTGGNVAKRLTRSGQHAVSVAELATSDSSPNNAGNLNIKNLNAVSTPSSMLGVHTRSGGSASPSLLQVKVEKSDPKVRTVGRPKGGRNGSGGNVSAKRLKLENSG